MGYNGGNDAFAGFSDRALELYVGLEADNSRQYWTDHKAEWEAEVRDPMRALVAALEDEFGPAKLFRPNRDIRFSKDKTPYKTHQGAFVAHGTVGVGWYLQIGSLAAAGGRTNRSTSSATGPQWRATRPARRSRKSLGLSRRMASPSRATG